MKKYKASLTVEASYVMAMVVFALAVLVRTAYSRCVETAEVMKLHWRVEQLRYQEEDREKSLNFGQVVKSSGKVEGYFCTAGSDLIWTDSIAHRLLRRGCMNRRKPCAL